ALAVGAVLLPSLRGGALAGFLDGGDFFETNRNGTDRKFAAAIKAAAAKPAGSASPISDWCERAVTSDRGDRRLGLCSGRFCAAREWAADARQPNSAETYPAAILLGPAPASSKHDAT